MSPFDRRNASAVSELSRLVAVRAQLDEIKGRAKK
jgi:hypothetical protein